MCPRLKRFLLAGATLLSCTAAAQTGPDAPRTDGGESRREQQRQQPIQIEADRAEMTEQSGVSVYSGKVNLTQGDLVMQGERLEVRRESSTGNLTAVLTGSPATLRQPTDAGEMVNAKATRIDYVSAEKSIALQGNAEFVRGRDRVNGQSIRYDANAKKLLASGGGAGGTGPGGGRVQIIIQPDENKASPGARSTP